MNIDWACNSQVFTIMGGYFIEEFPKLNANNEMDSLRFILKMYLEMISRGYTQVTEVGQTEGKFSKTRYEPYEIKDGVSLP